MKLLRLLLSGKPARRPKPKKAKKSLTLTVLDRIGSLGLDWLKNRWRTDLWDQSK